MAPTRRKKKRTWRGRREEREVLLHSVWGGLFVCVDGVDAVYGRGGEKGEVGKEQGKYKK